MWGPFVLFICPSVCLSVFLLPRLHNNYWTNFDKIKIKNITRFQEGPTKFEQLFQSCPILYIIFFKFGQPFQSYSIFICR